MTGRARTLAMFLLLISAELAEDSLPARPVARAANGAGQEQTGKPDRMQEVDALFAKWDRPDVPGCVVGIMRDGELVYSKGFGASNLESGVTNSSQTIFELASASKSFTCACLALLLDQGKLDPDDELFRFVPEIDRFDPPIRIRHLVLCHTGLWDPIHLMPLLGWENLPIQGPYTQADILTVLGAQKRLPFEPGTQFHYGGGDYFLLGLIVQRVTGQTLAAFAREHLFAPLGMTRTFYEEDPSLVVPGRAIGHYKQDGAWHKWRANAYLQGGGGLNTCLDDLVRWVRNFDANRLPRGKYMDEFLREGTLFGNRYVLDADAYRTKVQPNVDNTPMGQYRGVKRIQWTGGVWGMTAAISRFPDQSLTVLCLSNNDEISPFQKTKQIAELYLADFLAPLPERDQDAKPLIELPRGELEDKVGAYRLLSERRIWNVELRDGDLHVIDPTRKAWRIKPESATAFRPVGDTPFYRSARFHFRRASADQPHTLTLESNEQGFREVIEFRRVELAAPTAEAITEYAGEYVNRDLAATYRFEAREGVLWLRVGSRHWEQLDPTLADEFIPHVRTLHDNRIIRFRRDANHRIVGLAVSFWRVEDLEFQRRPARGAGDPERP